MSVVWILASCLFFATMSLLVKLAAADYSIAHIVFFRTLPGAIALLAYAGVRRLPLRTPVWHIHAVRNIVGIVSMGLAYYAIARLALATATCLEYTAPIFLLLYAVFVT